MTSTVSTSTILQQLTGGDAEPVLVAEFQAWTTAPRLSRLLSDRAEGRPVYQIDPVGMLTGEQLYLPLQDLAAACVEEFLGSGPPDGRVFIAGHCSASALSLHVARLLKETRDVTAILVRPVWPGEELVRSRFAEALSKLGAPGRPCPELGGDPAAAVAQMAQVLKEELIALAASRGVNGATDAFAELLAWHRGWLAFLLACHNDPTVAWAGSATEVIVLSGPADHHTVPGLSHDGYRVCPVPVISHPGLGQEDPITPELAEVVRAQITRR
jgi:hypothetical protein